MPTEARAVVLLLHLVAMLFMAAPLYALITVNERARFAVPPNYNTDRYLENVIKISLSAAMPIWRSSW